MTTTKTAARLEGLLNTADRALKVGNLDLAKASLDRADLLAKVRGLAQRDVWETLIDSRRVELAQARRAA